MSQFKIPLWTGIFLFFLGFGVDRAFIVIFHSDPVQKTDDLLQKIEDITKQNSAFKVQNAELFDKLSELARVDLAEYLRLQKEEDQFKKSRELLGKVFLILFSSILKDVPKEQLEFAQSASGEENKKEPEAIISSKADGQADRNPGASADKIDEPMAKNNSETKIKNTTWAQENDFSSINADKAEEFLAKNIIKDMAFETKAYKKFKATDSRLNMLQGSFAGDLIFEDRNRKPWRIEMTLSSETVDGIPKGSFSLRVIHDNNNASQSNGSGNLREIQQTASNSKALIVREGDSNYLQMYLFETQDSIVGNYYQKMDSGDAVRVGHFVLKR